MQLQKIIICLCIGFIFTQALAAQCLDDEHSTNEKDSWLSCQTSMIPNSEALTSYHWIYYDLGYNYALGTVKIWNYNVLDQTGKGIKDGEVFYSADGENWVSGGLFQIPEASGQNDYVGWEGIDLKGIVARFINIVAYSNWENSTCTGLSEVRFNIVEQTTSIVESQLTSSGMLVFPNPTNQVLSVNTKNNRPIKEFILLNNAGHEILRRSNLRSSFTLDVSTFLSGMYYIKVLTENQKYLVSKFVKTN